MGDEFWEPFRIERILRSWVHLDPASIALRARDVPRVLDEYRRHKGYVDQSQAWMGAVELRASLELKIAELPVWLTQPVVVLAFMEQLPTIRIAELLHCSTKTVLRERRIGIVMLARSLGYEGDVKPYLDRGKRSPDVWRKGDAA